MQFIVCVTLTPVAVVSVTVVSQARTALTTLMTASPTSVRMAPPVRTDSCPTGVSVPGATLAGKARLRGLDCGDLH